MYKYLLGTFVWLVSIAQVQAQDISHMPHKKKMLKGQWQLVRTYLDSTAHPVTPGEYDAVITMRPCHRYSEEVKYEGYHWIIKGSWQIRRHTTALQITRLRYLSGAPPGADLQDIHFTLYQLDLTHWSAATRTQAGPVKMEYTRLPKKK